MEWNLFDQSAANAEKMREELEEAANVSASFDELHDIGGETGNGNDAAMDLMGDIYKPEWNGIQLEYLYLACHVYDLRVETLS